MSFCVAYIDPRTQDPQVEQVAQYDHAIIRSDYGQEFDDWIAAIRALNPSIKLYGYTVLVHESFAKSEFAEHVRLVRPSRPDYPWIMDSEGRLPTYNGARLVEYFSQKAVNAFIEGALKVSRDPRFDGIFIDNCQVWGSQGYNADERIQASIVVQKIINEIKHREPQKSIVDNSRFQWAGSDAHMVEFSSFEDAERRINELKNSLGRILDAEDKLIFVTHTSEPSQEVSDFCDSLGVMYYASPNYQTITPIGWRLND